MADLVINSVLFFAITVVLACGMFALRASPIFRMSGGLAGTSWPEWFGSVIRDGRLGGGESPLPRVARLVLVAIKYGACAWVLFNPMGISVLYWTLLWTVLLVIALLRKLAQIHQPVRWEHLTLKLDDETFWLIHLTLLGTAELQIPNAAPWGLIFLVLAHILVIGRSEASLLASLEDVIGVVLGLFALVTLASPMLPQLDAISLFAIMIIILPVRGLIRAALGRDWLRHRFWWVAQFCLMTALIIKALVVLDVFPFAHS